MLTEFEVNEDLWGILQHQDSPLICATRHGHGNIMKFLLDFGANVEEYGKVQTSWGCLKIFTFPID